MIGADNKAAGAIAMKRLMKMALGASVALMLASVAQAGVTLFAARVGAEDVVGLAKFYQSAFGLHEVNRLEFPGMIEIMLNFGDSVDAARKNANGQIVIMHRESNAPKDPMPHLIFGVTDMAATVKAVKAAGGVLDAEPKEFGKTGIMIGMFVDPAGNHVELIQQPKR
jgi:predicted enzyme related to lactoylglutathione lyase